jgi:hypothetical protein
VTNDGRQDNGDSYVLAGVVGAAVGAYASNRDALRRDRANAERYENTEVALNGVAGRIDDVAEQIVAGEPKALVAFTETVCDLLSTEHKQWLEGTAQAAASLEKLNAQLEQLSKSQKQTPGTSRTPETAANAGSAGNAGRIGPALESAGFKQAVDF